MTGADKGGTENVSIDQTHPEGNKVTTTDNSQILRAAQRVERFLHRDLTFVAPGRCMARHAED